MEKVGKVLPLATRCAASEGIEGRPEQQWEFSMLLYTNFLLKYSS